MDGQRFDRLARLLGQPSSRRVILGLALGGGMGMLIEPREIYAKKRHRRGHKHHHHHQHKPSACEPDCTGKECGSDGCGGSCGTCAGDAICQQEEGICFCAGDICDDVCRASCGTELRDPLTCGCCKANGDSCVDEGSRSCCSGVCPFDTCLGRETDDQCEFDAQCSSGTCLLGFCT
jgi:hypothetical protein